MFFTKSHTPRVLGVILAKPEDLSKLGENNTPEVFVYVLKAPTFQTIDGDKATPFTLRSLVSRKEKSYFFYFTKT